MNTMLLQQMSPERKTQKLDRLFRTCQEGFRQISRAFESGHATTAIGTLKGLENIQEDIEVLMFGKKRSSLSIEVKIRGKLAELRRTTDALKAAITLKSVKDVRTFCRWAAEYISELAELY